MSEKQAITGRPRGKLPFAPEGWPFIITLLVLTVAAAGACWWITAGVLFGLLLFNINFFRDPERTLPEGEGLFICPADGKVICAEGDESGSRVDCEIPAGYELCVEVGEHVTVGKTVIARKAER